jgi:translation initiation factor IF-3
MITTTKTQEPRMNERIRVREVRLIDAEGQQVGIVPTEEARRLAAEAGLDLVEVAPDSRPPVCKVMDYGKFKYEQKKRQHAGKKVHHAKLKEVRLRPKTGDHDYEVKLRRAKDFLGKGDKVQLVLMFRGREMVHQDRGRALLERMVKDLQEVAKVERSGKMEGRRMTMLLAHK